MGYHGSIRHPPVGTSPIARSRMQLTGISSIILHMHLPRFPWLPGARRLPSFFSLALALVLLAACDLSFIPGPNSSTTPTPPSTPRLPTPTRPPQKPGTLLTIRLTADPPSFNPWLSGMDANAQSVNGLIFDGLTKLDDHLQPQPGLAESWDISQDGTSITFHLRQGVQWHDGKPFTAQDVIWSYGMLAKVPADTPAALHIQDTVAAVDAIDPVTYTVRFTLRRRYSPLLADLSTPDPPPAHSVGHRARQAIQQPF